MAIWPRAAGGAMLTVVNNKTEALSLSKGVAQFGATSFDRLRTCG